MGTKRMLAPIDLEKPDEIYKGFLYPNIDLEQVNSFLEIGSGKEWYTGRVVFIGVEITKNDVFTKIVDSGKKVKSVQGLLDSLEDYLEQISSFKLGDIVGVKPLENGFELIKLKKPKSTYRKLP